MRGALLLVPVGDALECIIDLEFVIGCATTAENHAGTAAQVALCSCAFQARHVT